MMKNYLVIGSGISGAVCARQLVDTRVECNVTVIDKRLHIGGNTYDYVNQYGVRVHAYGPHLLHHGSDLLHVWLSRFTRWTPYRHTVQVLLPSGAITDFPVNRRTVEDLLGKEFVDEAAFQRHMSRVRVQFDHAPRNTDEVFLASVGEDIANVLFRPYTKKMWGVDATQIEAAVGARIPVRSGYEVGYFNDKYQYLPTDGYTAMISSILSHERIHVYTNEVDDIATYSSYDKVYSTMPIDELCDYALGKLPYRATQFIHRTGGAPAFDAAVLNYTKEFGPTRMTHWNRLPGHSSSESREHCFTLEYPCEPSKTASPSYPVRNAASLQLLAGYQSLVREMWNGKVVSFGRLGSFCYLDMAPAALQAIQIAAKGE